MAESGQLEDDIFELKIQKAKCKTAFTKTKNKLLSSVYDVEELDKTEIRHLQDAFDRAQDNVSLTLEKLCVAYKEAKDSENVHKIQSEIEMINTEYSQTHEKIHEAMLLTKSTSDLSCTEDPKKQLGTDMWRQMKRVSIPIFDGDKLKYASWKAAFVACIDKAPASQEYKLLQLRQYLKGEALLAIENLGHSAASYEAAKERLERKFGGSRRQIALYLEELERFPPMKEENAKNIEKFADLLDIAVINMKEANKEEDLGDGSLYLQLQRKMPESMLTRYHRWIQENGENENVEILRNWINLESKYMTIANETINGLTQDRHKSKRQSHSETSHPKVNRTFFVNGKKQTYSKPQCKVCKEKHNIWECDMFKALTTEDRWNKTKELMLCFRCLCEGHMGNRCPKSRKCGINGCGKTHNRLLHETPNYILNQDAPEFIPSETTMTSNHKNNYIALRTVPVVISANGIKVKVNALLDDGSTKTYLNQDVASELGLESQLQHVNVCVMNGKKESFQTMAVTFEIENAESNCKLGQIEAFTTTNVTGLLSPIDWQKQSSKWQHLKDIKFQKLAKTNKIDLLIGLDYSDLHRSLKEVTGKQGEPTARLTPLGWTCVGLVSESAENSTYFTLFSSDNKTLDRTLRQFWEIERCDENALTMTYLDRKVLNSVEQTLEERDNFYTVSVPWKENKESLTNNYAMAFNRLKSTEKKLEKHPEVSKEYSETIEKYIEKGYVKKLDPSSIEEEKAWYLPHFAVVRPGKETTKVRIVFDASAKSNGISLNDVVHQGPKLQRELFDVLLRFRKHSIALACDVAEMYLQVGLNKADQQYHRFLWRTEPEERPDIYEFNRLVFGVNASPFLAQYVSQYNAKKYETSYPLAAETVQKSTYMDDSLDSVETVEKGQKLYSELTELWSKAGMHVRKWVSNSLEVLEHIPTEDRASHVDLSSGELPSLKTLGLLWNANEDCFSFLYNAPDVDLNITKRDFLKIIATVFDPLGLLAPFIMKAKIIMQDVWLSGIDWDDAVCADTANEIRQWFADLDNLKDIKVSRCIQQRSVSLGNPEFLSVHTFVDASTVAYGAVTYLRCTYKGDNPTVMLIAAKGRVAPLQSTSIPRLELLGAITGLKLTQRVCEAINVPIEVATFWSDSMNVLYWIRNHSRHLKPFVANRVGEIQSSTTPAQWRYVPSECNPADIISRGMTAYDLSNELVWWYGPEFLRSDESEWPENRVEIKSEAVKEVKKTKQPVCFVSVEQITDDTWRLNPKHFSKWMKLVRVLAWVYRFLNNCMNKKICGPLNSDEIRDSEYKLISQAQYEEFKSEIQAIRKSGKLSAKSKIVMLNPVLDEEGILRANSRLVNAEFLPYSVRYPIILPSKNNITFLIVRHFHELRNHCGTNDALAALSARYWVVHPREEIHRVERACMECHRRKAKTATQIMAPLPAIRLSMPLRAFSHTAIDYGGPFVTMQGRGKRREKRYLCLFTCLASRAVHLEIAFGLDTDSFLNAFSRFTNRRGVPVKVLSDRGTNFIGADRELKDLVLAMDTDKIVSKSAHKGIKWQFNPALAPHWGGAHEIMIKAAKRAIYAILRGADVSDEELMTAFTGAESLINSRPLTYQSSHPADATPLTPNHFLYGQMGGELAPEAVDNVSYSPAKRWRRVQELVRHFWQRWLTEWLPSLASRKKWFSENRDLEVDDIVLIISPDTPRGQWPLARVIEVYKGSDQHVRAVKIRVGTAEYVRPISKLCPLDAVKN